MLLLDNNCGRILNHGVVEVLKSFVADYNIKIYGETNTIDPFIWICDPMDSWMICVSFKFMGYDHIIMLFSKKRQARSAAALGA